MSQESELKETFRVFSKDDEGCITAEELKFVLTHLPGKVGNRWKYSQDLSVSFGSPNDQDPLILYLNI